MTSRLKNLYALKGKKRYIVLGLLACELMSLPAAAHIIQQTAFTERPRVSAIEIPTAEPGLSRYFVLSNAGFVVQSNHASGNISVNVETRGALAGGSRFGDSAQLPGAKTVCAYSTALNRNIYKADKTTVAKDGTPPEQAVVFEFRYTPDQTPNFEFIAGPDNDLDIIDCNSSVS